MSFPSQLQPDSQMVGRLVPLSQAANKGPGKPETSASKKERLLTCLSKLNDKDTQKRAADELAELLQVRDPAAAQVRTHPQLPIGHREPVR